MKSPEFASSSDDSPAHLLSPPRKCPKTGSSAAQHAALTEKLSLSDYETMMDELRNECTRATRNEDHLKQLLEVPFRLCK